MREAPMGGALEPRALNATTLTTATPLLWRVPPPFHCDARIDAPVSMSDAWRTKQGRAVLLLYKCSSTKNCVFPSEALCCSLFNDALSTSDYTTPNYRMICQLLMQHSVSVTLDCKSAPLMGCGKNWNYVLTVATLVARNQNDPMVVPMVRSGGSLEAGGRFCVRAFGRNLASVAVKMLSLLISFITKFCNVWACNTICKKNIVRNLLLLNKKVSFPSNTTGRAKLVVV
jgi:hypothetical protein